MDPLDRLHEHLSGIVPADILTAPACRNAALLVPV